MNNIKLMADSDKINLANRIIKKQCDLIDSFDEWIRFIKLNDMESASEVVKTANKLRDEIKVLKQQYEKLNKRSGIILLN